MLAQNPHKASEAVNPSPFDSTQGLLFQLPPPRVFVLRTPTAPQPLLSQSRSIPSQIIRAHRGNLQNISLRTQRALREIALSVCSLRILREAEHTMQKHRGRRGGQRFQKTSWLVFWNPGLKRLSWANLRRVQFLCRLCALCASSELRRAGV